MAETKVSLKLLIEQKSQRVLFAEADKSFVDLLFSIFTLPLGTVTRLLRKQNMAGCLRSLYKSIENLSDIYIQPDQDKNFLLSPKVANISGAKVPLLLPSLEQSGTDRKIYRCGGYNNCQYVANDPRAICPSCRNQMATEQTYVDYPPKDTNASSSSEGGYVKGVITYMVMDDLEVKPMSTISSISLLTKFNVRDLGAVEEKVVDLGMHEVLSLLEASLQSKTVLTDIFLRNNTDKEEKIVLTHVILQNDTDKDE
ncbi:uncharacterized protein LOC132188541 [Corylus avellana]|uniref:uncharacterized protein LOC132188541 n=1 Tax=Corylus avellana TaxID=13451 RepID=UPI001E218911|nr:uncharacterized protein LOC132188541 [Corylus avellana]